METKHTPGPWKAFDGTGNNGRPWVAKGPDHIAEMWHTPGGGTIANARLIAAAPDLLAALKALQLQALQSADLRKTEWGEQALAEAQAAIAKATGATE